METLTAHFMEDDSIGPSPALPPELLQLVIEEVCSAYPHMMPTLCLVSRRIHRWVQPSLYHVVMRTFEEEESYPFPRTPPHTHLSFYAPHVRHLLLRKDDPQYEILTSLPPLPSTPEYIEDLRSCQNVTNLALWIPEYHSEAAQVLLTSTNWQCRVKRLSMHLRILTPECASVPDFGAPFFHNVTHLDVLDHISNRDWSAWKGLADLPCLTHLAVEGDGIDAFVSSALEHCGGLVVMVQFCCLGDVRPGMDGRKGYHPKLVLMRALTDVLADWERGARGDSDFWHRAKNILAES